MRRHTNKHAHAIHRVGGVAAPLCVGVCVCVVYTCVCLHGVCVAGSGEEGLMFAGRVHVEPQRSSTQVYKIMKQLAPFALCPYTLELLSLSLSLSLPFPYLCHTRLWSLSNITIDSTHISMD